MKERIAELLSELDRESPAEVAGVLKAAGIKGKPGEECECPVAKYLQKGTGNSRVYVLPSYVEWRKGRLGDTSRTVYGFEEVPDVVRQFIRRFDNREYPDLEE
jgi:hypothetical protein